MSTPRHNSETEQRRIVRTRTGQQWMKLLRKVPTPLRFKLGAMIWWDYFSLLDPVPPEGGAVLKPLMLEWLYNKKWVDIRFSPGIVEAALIHLDYGPIHARRRAYGEKELRTPAEQP